jgi:anti-sigma factor RsiW
MNCRSAEDFFSSFVEDELSQRERRSLDAHLAECRRCSTAVEELRSTVQLLAKAPTFEVSPDFDEAVMDRIRTGEALRPTVIEWLQETLAPARLRPMFLAGAGACAVWIAVLIAGPIGQGFKAPVIADRDGASAPVAPRDAGVAVGEDVATSGLSSEVGRSASEATLAVGPQPVESPRASARSRERSRETSPAASGESSASETVSNPSTPYQDEYILDHFYLNRSVEGGNDVIVPASGRASDDVYITF